VCVLNFIIIDSGLEDEIGMINVWCKAFFFLLSEVT
jgi:hypothetical protein